MFKDYRIVIAVASALCCVYNLYTANVLLALVCGVAAVGNYWLAKEGK